MSTQEIVVDDYKFSYFILSGQQLRFFVTPVSGRDVTEEDQRKVEAMLSALGKWESLMKTGLQLFSDLGFISSAPAALEILGKPFGAELYSIGVNLGRDLTVLVTLKPEERHRREAIGLEPLFQVEEIRDQISNLPKWKAFKQTMKILKEHWVTR